MSHMLSRKRLVIQPATVYSDTNIQTPENDSRVLECIVGKRIYTFKMADTGNYPRITGDKQ